ncbi:MAG: AraC family transcriptional regulator [Oscillospiraceae bacterium]
MEEQRDAGKRGYLNENFRLFHLKDSRAEKMDYHYHEFDKIVLMLRGKVTYVVEGVRYFLQPWDILLVPHNMIHVPLIDPSEPYERIVIWCSGDYLQRLSPPEEPLATCFETARARNFLLLREDKERWLHYMRLLGDLEESLCSREFGHALLTDSYFLQLLISINRDSQKNRTADEARRCDPKMEEVLQYISSHLEEDLTVEALAGRFYLSRYYLMHRFKAVTGYTLHQYINQKRLLRAGELLRAGVPVMKAAETAGFREYSTFLRAFRGTFHASPRDFNT